jgi:hypothetical protein
MQSGSLRLRKAQWARGQVAPAVTLVRKRNQNVNRAKNILNHPVGGIQILRRNELPNFVKVG